MVEILGSLWYHKPISTTIEKLNKDYKPLGVAVFLAIGGLLSGLLVSSFFVANPAGMVKETRVQGASSIIPQAEGAEIDSAALTPQSAPFLASENVGSGNFQPSGSLDTLYGEAALKDSGPVIKTKAVASTAGAKKALASGVIYQVVTGDTVESISAAFNVPIDMIVEFNPSVNFFPLNPGVSIVIPGKKDVMLFLD